MSQNEQKQIKNSGRFDGGRAKDPQFRAAQVEREQARKDKVGRLLIASEPLNEALRKVGAPIVSSVWDLVNSKESYVGALPVLIEHLTKEYPDEILDGIARALAVPEALKYRSKLIELFLRDPPVSNGFRYGLGVAIAHTTGPDNLYETVELLRDKSLGANRLPLLLPMRRSRKPEVREIIKELSFDSDLAKEIASWKLLK